MFDSTVDCAVPGKIALIGRPWHGRVDYQTTYAPMLTLSNGEQVRLPQESWWSTNEAPQHGTLLRFRDPRAVDPERTPEQQQADQEAGIEWRADVLYNPRNGLQIAPRNRTGSQSWLWHDGNENWVVKLSSTGVTITPATHVIGARAQWNGQYISVPGLAVNSRAIILDALPDGSKALIAQLADPNKRTYWPAGYGSLQALSDLDPEFGVKEIELIPAAEHYLYTGLVRDVFYDDPLPEPYQFKVWEEELLVTNASPTDGGTIVSVGVVRRDDAEETVRMTEFSLTRLSGNARDIQVEGASSGRATFGVTPHVSVNTSTKRIISAHYKGDGEIAATWLAINREDECERRYEWEQITDFAPYSSSSVHIANAEVYGIWMTTLRLELSCDNEPFSRVIHRYTSLETGNIQINVDGRGQPVAGSRLSHPFGINEAPARTKIYSQTKVLTLDSETVYEQTVVHSAQSGNSDHSTFPSAGYFLAVERYAAQLPVFTVSESERLFGNLNAYYPDRYKHGAVYPPGGPVTPCPYELAPKEPRQAIYGSWNPVTGEIIRDALHPVSFV